MPERKTSDAAKSKSSDEAAKKRGYFDFRKKDENEEAKVYLLFILRFW